MENQEQEQIEEQLPMGVIDYKVAGIDPEVFAHREQFFIEKLNENPPTTHSEMVALLEEVYQPREISLLLSIMNAAYTRTQQELEQTRQAVTMLIAQNNFLSDKLALKRGKESIPVRRNSKGYPMGSNKEGIRQHFKKKADKMAGRGDAPPVEAEESTEE